MMLVCYGQDIGESWQWSGQGFMPVDVSMRHSSSV